MGKQPTYQELLEAYNKLLMENGLLHKEIDMLQSLLNSKGTSSTRPTIKQHLSLEEKVDVFARRCIVGQVENQATSLYAGMNGTG